MKAKKIIILVILTIISVSLFAQKKIDDDSFYERYSDIFSALSSSPVVNLPEGENAVRLLSISSYPCYIIKLVWTEESRTLVFTRGDEDGTKMVSQETIAVSKDSINEFLALIEEKDFYNQPTYIHNNGRDGETWLLEVNIDGRYKAVDRWLPMRGTEFLRELGRKLLRMAGKGRSQEEIEASKKAMENYNDNLKLRIKKK